MRPELITSAPSINDPGMKSGSEEHILDMLQNIRDMDGTWADRVTVVRSYLDRTESSMIRGYAALALVDLAEPGAASAIIDVLRRPDVAGQSGTLLFALNELKASLPLDIAVTIAREGSYEAQDEVFAAIEDDRIAPFDTETADRAVAAMSRVQEGASSATTALAEHLLDYVAARKARAESH